MKENQSFDTFALVELFGHVRIAGRVSEQVIAGQGFVRVDVPETKKLAAFTRLFGPGAIYSITPISEEMARALAESIYQPEIVPMTPRKQLSEPADDVPF